MGPGSAPHDAKRSRAAVRPQEGGLHDLITLVVSSRVYITVLASQALIPP